MSNFDELRDPSKSRGEYIADLKQAACEYYSYNEQLVDMFFDLFSPKEVLLIDVINDINLDH